VSRLVPNATGSVRYAVAPEKSCEIAIGFDLDPGLLLSKVTEELSGETARVREREEMVTWKLVDAGV
jgi:hypothetical protein